MPTINYFQDKYLKYKNKYLSLKKYNLIGGNPDDEIIDYTSTLLTFLKDNLDKNDRKIQKTQISKLYETCSKVFVDFYTDKKYSLLSTDTDDIQDENFIKNFLTIYQFTDYIDDSTKIQCNTNPYHFKFNGETYDRITNQVAYELGKDLEEYIKFKITPIVKKKINRETITITDEFSNIGDILTQKINESIDKKIDEENKKYDGFGIFKYAADTMSGMIDDVGTTVNKTLFGDIHTYDEVDKCGDFTYTTDDINKTTYIYFIGTKSTFQLLKFIEFSNNIYHKNILDLACRFIIILFEKILAKPDYKLIFLGDSLGGIIAIYIFIIIKYIFKRKNTYCIAICPPPLAPVNISEFKNIDKYLYCYHSLLDPILTLHISKISSFKNINLTNIDLPRITLFEFDNMIEHTPKTLTDILANQTKIFKDICANNKNILRNYYTSIDDPFKIHRVIMAKFKKLFNSYKQTIDQNAVDVAIQEFIQTDTQPDVQLRIMENTNTFQTHQEIYNNIKRSIQ
jgi:hypothetical protein